MAYSPAALDLQIQVDARTNGLTVSGEIDLATAPHLRRAVLAALQHGSGTVHLDLEGITFMDTSGMHVLVAAVRRSRLMGGHVGLTAVSPKVQRIIDLTGARAEPHRGCTCRSLAPTAT